MLLSILMLYDFLCYEEYKRKESLSSNHESTTTQILHGKFLRKLINLLICYNLYDKKLKPIRELVCELATCGELGVLFVIGCYLPVPFSYDGHPCVCSLHCGLLHHVSVERGRMEMGR